MIDGLLSSMVTFCSEVAEALSLPPGASESKTINNNRKRSRNARSTEHNLKEDISINNGFLNE